jgi:hypothetical protein
VDHYAPTHDLTQPWRTRTLIVSGIAAAELVALIAVGVVLLGKGWFQHARAETATQKTASHATSTTHPKPRPTTTTRTATRHSVAPAKPLPTRSQTSVLVLNGNGESGAAGAEARALRARGYPIAAVGNATRTDYATSIVMYRPAYQREARRLAHDVGSAIVSPLDGLLTSQLHGATLLLILGK